MVPRWVGPTTRRPSRISSGLKGSAIKPVPQFDQGLLYNFIPLTSIFGALAVLDPLVAKDLVELGYDTKEKLCDWLQRNATLPVKDAKTMLFTGGAALQGPQAAA